MGSGFPVFLLIMCLQNLVIQAVTDPNDFAALNALKSQWKNKPPNWIGSDPCGRNWEGISCTDSRISSIILAGMGLSGTLSGDIGNFPELQTLDLSQNKGLKGVLPPSIVNLNKLETLILVGCSFSGPIPGKIGSLAQLVSLSLASNNFNGPIPPSIGNLSRLFLLDLTGNQLNGTIPVSDGTSPGLDMLLNARHFHLGKNQLTGIIPPNLFSSNMKLVHLLLDSNQLSGRIPSTLDLVQPLEVIRLDRNSLTGSILVNFTNLASLSELYLSNNNFSGTMPDLGGMNLLTYVDMSNNSFNASPIPQWFSSLQSLTSLIMERAQLQGPINASLFSPSQLQSIVLSNNQLNGTLDIGTNYGSQLQLIDLQNNYIADFAQETGYNKVLLLEGNPICQKLQSSEYCTLPQPNSSYDTPKGNCVSRACTANQILSPSCSCAYPISGILHFRSFSFSDFQNGSYYEPLRTSMMQSFNSDQLPVDSISLSVPFKDDDDYLEVRLEIFPSGNVLFNRTGSSLTISQLSNITFIKLPDAFGPFFFTLDNDNYFAGSKKSSTTGIIIGAAVGGSIFLLLLLTAGVYAFCQRKKADQAIRLMNPFASWDQNKNTGAPPQIKGVTSFSFEELKKYTNNFSEDNVLGSGGYGKVYRGTLPTGVLVAIKRAKQGSLQGSLEFKTEIELLSRVHHKNLVSLLGFCFQLGEQMLVYEYVKNGTLTDCISGRSGFQLSWARRLGIALDSAKGVAYLHELANPPIIHRDIKSNNILLDDQLVAKVADFGLSKPMNNDGGHVSTTVKGTLGYMDPEYFMTGQLTEKSDVYSFGVVMLELVTGRKPIEHGKYIVKEVMTEMDNQKTKDSHNLHGILDPAINLSTQLTGLEKFTDLAIRCVEEAAANRPTMNQVVKELENIQQLASFNGKDEMISTITSYSGTTEGSFYHPYTKAALFEYSGSFPHSEIELQK